MRSKNIRESLDQQHLTSKRQEKAIDFPRNASQKGRPIEQVSFSIGYFSQFESFFSLP